MSTETNVPRGGYVFDLSVGESVEFRGRDGSRRKVTLVALHEERDRVRGVIRFSRVTIDIDGKQAELASAHYQMPQIVNGVRIDCSLTRGIAEALEGTRHEILDKDARIRCWDPAAPLFDTVPLVYPVGQIWFASMTQMANERVFVDAGELPVMKPGAVVFHHRGMDFGGHDRAVPVIAAHSGMVVVCGDEELPGYDGSGGTKRYDRVIIRDEKGWYYMYSHLDMIDLTVKLGQPIAAGDPVGVLGKEGESGGWAHLHFSITSLQPNGRYGEVEGYPFLVEAYLRKHPGALLACARPHRVALIGEEIEMDGNRSLCDGAAIKSFQWTLHNGKICDRVRAKIAYEREGMYSEMLTVTDNRGQTDVDFCVVQVLPPDGNPAKTPPTMHLTCYPTENIVPRQPIAFKVRTFFGQGNADPHLNRAGEERWDFGDGTTAISCSGAPPRVSYCAEKDFDERWHAYAKPGRYIVTVQRTAKNDMSATAQLKVNVGNSR